MNHLQSREKSIDDTEENHILQNTLASVRSEVKNLSSAKTAYLWLQYMQVVYLLRMFMKGERFGNWDLHLQACMTYYAILLLLSTDCT